MTSDPRAEPQRLIDRLLAEAEDDVRGMIRDTDVATIVGKPFVDSNDLRRWAALLEEAAAALEGLMVRAQELEASLANLIRQDGMSLDDPRDGPVLPKAGDLTMCAYCSAALMFTETGLRLIVPQEIAQFPPETQELYYALLQEVSKRRGRPQ
jgi:hypothetical protein